MTHFTLSKSVAGLREVSSSNLDLRPDADIIAELQSFRPITSEKNVWAFWDKGFELVYPCHQRTVINWVRKLGPSWTIRLVDTAEGSPNNIFNYVSKDWFPSCFLDGTMDGRHAPQHTADLVRLPLLFDYGGVWMDVSNILHTHLDRLFWNHLADPGSAYEMGVWIITGQIRKKWGSFGNFMLASRKGCVFIKNWHNGYKELWTGRTNAVGFHEHPLIQEIGLADGMEDWDMHDKVKPMSDYVAQMIIGDRTRNLLDVGTSWNGREFFANKVFRVEGLPNGILGAIKTNYDGRKQAEYFTTRLDEPDVEKRREAEEFVVEMLEKSDMYKLYHNSAGGGLPTLGDLIKSPEYRDALQRPGTFGELYRYGTVHWEAVAEVECVSFQETDDKLIHATPTQPASQ